MAAQSHCRYLEPVGVLVFHASRFTLAAAMVVAGVTVGAQGTPASATPAWDAAIDITYPVDGPVTYTDDYHAARSGGRVHAGTDLGRSDAYGLPIHAAMAGTVSFITNLDGTTHRSGYMIRVTGDDGRQYWYIHLGRDAGPASEAYAPGIASGVRVSRGQHIGYLGHSGNASDTWPHLHFEIHDPAVTDPYGNNRRNPYPSLVAAQARGDLPSSPTPAAPVSVPEAAVPVPGDWNGDGSDQEGWFHDGVFYTASGPSGAIARFRYGRAGDQPVSGDWNRSGSDGIGVFRDGMWYVRNELSGGPSWRHFRYGRAGDQAVTGDWARLGRDGVGVFRDGVWYVRTHLNEGPSWRHFRYGRAGDIAVSGDWEQLGRHGVGVVRDGNWFVRSHLNAGPSAFYFPYGRSTDRAVTGDWNGNSGDTPGIVRTGQWRLSNHLPARSPDTVWN
jgi:hypothetical protein